MSREKSPQRAELLRHVFATVVPGYPGGPIDVTVPMDMRDICCEAIYIATGAVPKSELGTVVDGWPTEARITTAAAKRP